MEGINFITRQSAAYNTAEEQAPRAFVSLADSLKDRFNKAATTPQQRYVRRGIFITELTEGINRRQPFYVDQKTGKKKQLKPLSTRAVAVLTGHLSERKLEHLKDLCKETEQLARQGSKGFEGRTFSKEFFVRLQHDERFKKPEGWVSQSKRQKAQVKPKAEKPTTATLFQ